MWAVITRGTIVERLVTQNPTIAFKLFHVIVVHFRFQVHR